MDGRNGERSAAELVEQFGAQMRATARRYSANADDADDAYQRTAEILLRVRPTGNDEQVLRWLRTTVKREAFAVGRKRLPVAIDGEVPDAADHAGSAADRAERFEQLRLGAEALGRLKPQEVRALLLRAEGLSYKEICAETGWTYTKVNRCVTEGRRAFLQSVAGIESGAECERVAPALSALADGEAKAADLVALRPHLGGCPKCRARLREYRDVPARVAALVPPVAFAGGGPGPIRGALEQLVGAAQDRIAMLGERGHQLAELATGQKVAAIGASAAVLAGGGAATVEVVERGAQPAPAAAEQPATTPQTTPAPAAAPEPAPPASAAPTPQPEPEPAPRPPSASNEFAPEASPAAPSRAAPVPSEFGPSGGSGGSGGEFAP